MALEVDGIDEHMTDREQLIVQIARALLSDPHVLMINLKFLPFDEWSEHLYLLLLLWRRAGSLKEFLFELRQVSRQDTGDVAQLVVARIRELGEAAVPPDPMKVRTLVMIPSSLWRLVKNDHLSSGLDSIIHLCSSGKCVVDSLEATKARGPTRLSVIKKPTRPPPLNP